VAFLPHPFLGLRWPSREAGIPEVGQIIDRYEVEAELGTGGMATVYRVRHTRLDSLHALKVLHVSGKGITQRLLGEGRAQAGLDHPNALTVTDVVEVDGLPGLVMEYVPDGTLQDWVETHTPSREARLDVFLKACGAVGAAHARGWVHRDLKPQNILIKHTEDGPVPKVADFGLVKAVVGDEGLHDGPKTRGGMPMGTPGYMAPEQVESAADVDARADVYSLGCILVWLLTDAPAFDAETMLDLFVQVAAGEHRSLPVDDPLFSVAEIALSTDRSERQADARELKQAIEATIDRGEGPAGPPRPSPTTPGPLPDRSARPLVLGLAAAAAGGAVVLTGIAVSVIAGTTLMSVGAGCPTTGSEPIGWVHGTKSTLGRVPDPYEPEGSVSVYAEPDHDSAVVCTLPAGRSIDVTRKVGGLSTEFWVAGVPDDVGDPEPRAAPE
jgi:serine/threonine protein kinase